MADAAPQDNFNARVERRSNTSRRQRLGTRTRADSSRGRKSRRRQGNSEYTGWSGDSTSNAKVRRSNAALQELADEFDQSDPAYPSISKQFEQDQAKRRTDPRDQSEEAKEMQAAQRQQARALRARAREEDQIMAANMQQIQQVVQRRQQKLKKSKFGAAVRIARKAALRVINGVSLLPIILVHLLIIMLAIFQLIFLGLAFVVEGSWLVSIVGALNDATNYLTGLSFGFSASQELMGIAILCWWAIMSLVFMQLFFLAMAYKGVGVRLLSGKHAAWKWIAFFGMIIGYTIPLVNFFPWIIPWRWIVSKNPN